MFRSVSDQFTCKSKRCQGLTVNFSIAVPLLQRFAEEFFAYPKNTDCSKLAEAKVIKLSLWLPSFQVCLFPPLAPPLPLLPITTKTFVWLMSSRVVPRWGICHQTSAWGWGRSSTYSLEVLAEHFPNCTPNPTPTPPPPSMAFSLRLLSTKSSATSVLDHALSRLVFRGARI